MSKDDTTAKDDKPSNRRAVHESEGKLDSDWWFERGFNVVPVDHKRPTKRVIRQGWKKWCEYRQTLADHVMMFEGKRRFTGEFTGTGMGVITGHIGSLAVLDIDGPEGEALLGGSGITLPRTWEVKTKRGRHLWFKIPPGRRQRTIRVKGLELKADGGGYAIVPPSYHPRGGRYTWTVSPEDCPERADLPDELVKLVETLAREVAHPLPIPHPVQTRTVSITLQKANQPEVSRVIEKIEGVQNEQDDKARDRGEGVKKMGVASYLDTNHDTTYTPPTLAEPLTTVRKGDLERLFSDLQVVRAVASVLGIPSAAVNFPKVGLGVPFNCVLPGHNEKHPSASLYTNSKGLVIYRDWHKRNREDVYTLPTVYFIQTTGKVPVAREVRRSLKGGFRLIRTINLSRAKGAVWALRLLIEARLLQPIHVDLPDLPEPALESTKKVYERFKLLLACKWTYEPGPGEPTSFARDFAAEWCGVSPVTAGEATKRLVAHGIIRPAGRHMGTEGMTLYLPGPSSDGTRR